MRAAGRWLVNDERMSNPPQQLAELMNQRTARGPTGCAPDAHIEKVAHALYTALGAKAAPVFARKLRNWSQLVEDADDLQQLAAVAFIRAWQEGRIRPDADGRHSAESVSRYLWGVCNNIFLQIVRRQRASLEFDAGREKGKADSGGGLAALLVEAAEADEEQRLWEVLAALEGRCKPEDLLMAWLHGCGFTPGEICLLADVSINMPAKALRRVGRGLRELLMLEEAPTSSGAGLATSVRGMDARASGALRRPLPIRLALTGEREPWMDIPIELLAQKKYGELARRMGDTGFRSRLLEQAAAAFGPAGGEGRADGPTADDLAARRALMRESGDWTWGLLTKRERLVLLQRDFGLLKGSGIPDGGAAQLSALNRLRPRLREIYRELNLAMDESDLEYLLHCAGHLSSLLDMSSRFKEAEARYQALLEGARRLEVRRLELLALLGLTQAHWRQSSYAEARTLAAAARDLAIELGDRQSEAASLYHLGAVENNKGDFTPARELFTQSLAIYREIGNRWGEANTLNSMAIASFSQDDLPGARELLAQSLVVFRELGDRRNEAHCLNNLGLLENLQGSCTAARQLHEQALTIYHELGDRLGEANSLGNLGMVENELCNYVAASEFYSQTLVIFRELGDRRSEALSLSNLGAVEHDQGNYAAARELLDESLSLFRELGDLSGEARALNILANGESEQGRYAAASELYARSLAIRTEIGASSGIADACPGMAGTLAGLRYFPAAALVLHGGQKAALDLGYELGLHEQRIIEATLATIDAAVAAGDASAVDLAEHRARAEGMSIEELAEYTLAALEHANRS
jgi:tetratricopeptide (TPR) repeat protein